MSESKTPRTDALVDDMLSGDGMPSCAEVDRLLKHARDFEAELSAALQCAEKAEKELTQMSAGMCLHQIHGDDGGVPYCPRIRELETELSRYRADTAVLQSKLLSVNKECLELRKELKYCLQRNK